MPKPNNEAVRSSDRFAKLFKTEVPEFVKRFECADNEKMAKYWPAGTDAAMQVT